MLVRIARVIWGNGKGRSERSSPFFVTLLARKLPEKKENLNRLLTNVFHWVPSGPQDVVFFYDKSTTV